MTRLTTVACRNIRRGDLVTIPILTFNFAGYVSKGNLNFTHVTLDSENQRLRYVGREIEAIVKYHSTIVILTALRESAMEAGRGRYCHVTVSFVSLSE